MDSVWTSMPFVKNTEDAGANAGVAKKGDSSGSPPLQNGPPEGMSSIRFGRVRRHRARPLLGRCLVAVGLRAEHLPLARDDLSEAAEENDPVPLRFLEPSARLLVGPGVRGRQADSANRHSVRDVARLGVTARLPMS